MVSLGLGLSAALVLASCSSGNAATSGSGKSGGIDIALSNSYIGNTWRIEMENEYKAACHMPPFKGHVKCSVYNANNNVSSQKQQLSGMVASGVQAIVTDAASPTGLNGTIKQACSRGILVVSFDNTVTAPCALKVNQSQYKMGQLWAQWLAKRLHGHGNVLMITGVSGTYVNKQRNAGAAAVWKKYPGIHVVDRVNGKWDSQVAHRVVAAALPTLPKIDGIWSQGGTNGVLKALKAAGRPFPPIAGEAENGFRKAMAQGKVHGYSIGQPPYMSVVALGIAYNILNHHLNKSKYMKFNMPLKPVAVTNANDKQHKAWFQNVGGDFFADVTPTGSAKVVKGLCLQAAKSGKTCPGKLTFNFSPTS